ncbi:MAG: LacI family DNA-binding transcriptional regulator [Phycisphaeraceae bacterium]|nr:LacI family DNA-binding transcriptional regulator [Phycisphaeraceae bacterium]
MISSLELARLCGVSQATVDRAIHQRPGISVATRDRILRLAEKHGYRPNPVAGELLRGDRRVVGAIIPAFGRVFFMDLMAALTQELSRRGQRLFLSPLDQEGGFLDAIEDFAARRVKAILIIPPSDDLVIPDRLIRATTIVSLISPCRAEGVRLVTPDELQAGRDATAFLLQRGHRRILHVTYTRQSQAIHHRAAGYEAEMRRHKLPCHQLASPTPRQLMDAIEQRQATALFCHNDRLAVWAMRVVQSQGLRVPEDVSVMGVDNTPTLREVWPDLTTMTYPMASVSAVVAGMINDEKDLPAIAGFEVVERGTVRRV